MGKSLPSEKEMEVGIVGFHGVEGADDGVLGGDLGVDDRRLKGDEAGFAPTDGGKFFDHGLLDVILRAEAGFETVDVEEEVVGVLDGEDDVDDGCETVFERIPAGVGFSFDGGRAFGFGAVDTGLLGVGEMFGLFG